MCHVRARTYRPISYNYVSLITPINVYSIRIAQWTDIMLCSTHGFAMDVTKTMAYRVNISCIAYVPLSDVRSTVTVRIMQWRRSIGVLGVRTPPIISAGGVHPYLNTPRFFLRICTFYQQMVCTCKVYIC